MTTIDLHPEDMLDAARRGTLGAAAAEDLHAHLDRCAACRLSLTLPDELHAEAAVTSADDALVASLVRGALRGEPRVAVEERPHRTHASAGRRVAVALALLLVGGSGGAAVWSMGGATFARRFVPEILQLPRRHEPAAPPRLAPVVAVPERAPVPGADSPPVAPVVAPLLEPPAPPAAPAHLARIHVPLPTLPRVSADELFTEANRARRAGDYALALRRYADLRRAYPGSRAELTARVVAGDLLLAEGPTRDALASFDSYLATSPTGTLAEEALVGRASALMRLGRRDEEREAWTRLLREHPGSVQGARARRRLAELR
ncbi:MAG TPA: tetratricopeptide repeat protein [Polyangia bacterium]|nr:tetratricopeptide repeat protein [Polyangia bacterium]